MRNDNVVYQTITSPKGELKATIVSIAPFEINVTFPGVIPGNYKVRAAVNEEPEILHVKEAHHYVYIDPDRGQLKVIDPAYQVAQSIVEDFCQGQLQVAQGRHPGIFWEIGEWSVAEVKDKFSGRLKDIVEIQDAWFLSLVSLADDDWERTRQHAMISDTQRQAARSLIRRNKLRDDKRPWLLEKPKEGEIENLKLVLCPACYSEVPEKAAVCRYCGVILDAGRAANLKFAEGSAANIAQGVLSKMVGK